MTKTNKIVKTEIQNDVVIVEMLSWTPEERRTALREAFTHTAESILKAARIIAAMTQACDDLSEIPTGILAFMNRINSGQMLPQVYVEYDGLLRTRIAALPVTDQERLISGDRVKVVRLLPEEPGKAARTDIRESDPRDLEPTQVKQVFAKGYIRSEQQQVSYLESIDVLTKRNKDTGTPSITLDKRHKRLIISGTEVVLSANELATYLQQLTSQ
jgi:hypothetical protein